MHEKIFIYICWSLFSNKQWAKRYVLVTDFLISSGITNQTKIQWNFKKISWPTQEGNGAHLAYWVLLEMYYGPELPKMILVRNNFGKNI